MALPDVAAFLDLIPLNSTCYWRIASVKVNVCDRNLRNEAGRSNHRRLPFAEWQKHNQAVKLGKYNEAAEFGDFVVNATIGERIQRAHPDAKTTVKELLISFGWKERNILDLGDITTARGTQ